MTKSLVDLNEALMAAEYCFTIIISNLGFNAKSLWTEELKKYLTWIFESNHEQTEDIIQNPHGFLLQPSSWPNELMESLIRLFETSFASNGPIRVGSKIQSLNLVVTVYFQSRL